jgi:hypothetical protein
MLHTLSVRLGVVVLAVWFVTFEIRKRGLLAKKERRSRETQTFATETEAKVFARSKLEEVRSVFAGTIIPYCPRRLVLPGEIAGWVEEGTDSTIKD